MNYAGQATRVLMEHGVQRKHIKIEYGPPVRLFRCNFEDTGMAEEMLRRDVDHRQVTNTEDDAWQNGGCLVSQASIHELLENE